MPDWAPGPNSPECGESSGMRRSNLQTEPRADETARRDAPDSFAALRWAPSARADLVNSVCIVHANAAARPAGAAAAPGLPGRMRVAPAELTATVPTAATSAVQAAGVAAATAAASSAAGDQLSSHLSFL